MGWAVGKLDRKTSIFILKSLKIQPVLLGSYSAKPFSILSI
ncbi:hypothetical protein IKS_03025 [Bacillus cereus VDM062]|nr:hypothetical protein IKO_02088 [Bacillus cereus VDM034]EJS13901.1 hypothetical protein IKS_03025 [Bacillus cereus VDM062]